MQHTSGDMEMLYDALFYLSLDGCHPSSQVILKHLIKLIVLH